MLKRDLILSNCGLVVEDITINKIIIECSTDYIVKKKYRITTYKLINKVRGYGGLLLLFELFR